MRFRLMFALLSASCLMATGAHAERHYDCTKPGNANKTACKSASTAPPAAPPVAPAAAAKMTTTSAKADRRYDCTKAGNANKAACKSAPAAATAAMPTAPSAAPKGTATHPNERRYDCTKAGNAKKAACKSVPAAATAPPAETSTVRKPNLLDRMRKIGTPSQPTASAPAPAAPVANSAPRPPATAQPAAPHPGKSITADPAGATGQCKDGSYTHAVHHSGACSSHGGVAKWL